MLDTNICIFILDGTDQQLLGRVSALKPGSAVISTIALAELARGRRGAGPLPRVQLDRFMKVFPSQPFDASAAMAFAALPLRRNRFDRLIAAHALALGLTLVTNNGGDFADISDCAWKIGRARELARHRTYRPARHVSRPARP